MVYKVVEVDKYDEKQQQRRTEFILYSIKSTTDGLMITFSTAFVVVSRALRLLANCLGSAPVPNLLRVHIIVSFTVEYPHEPLEPMVTVGKENAKPMFHSSLSLQGHQYKIPKR